MHKVPRVPYRHVCGRLYVWFLLRLQCLLRHFRGCLQAPGSLHYSHDSPPNHQKAREDHLDGLLQQQPSEAYQVKKYSLPQNSCNSRKSVVTVLEIISHCMQEVNCLSPARINGNFGTDTCSASLGFANFLDDARTIQQLLLVAKLIDDGH